MLPPGPRFKLKRKGKEGRKRKKKGGRDGEGKG